MNSVHIPALFTHSNAVRVRTAFAISEAIRASLRPADATERLRVGVVHGLAHIQDAWTKSLAIKLKDFEVEALTDLERDYDFVVILDLAFAFTEQEQVPEVIANLCARARLVFVCGTLPLALAKPEETDSWALSHRFGNYANYYLQALNGEVNLIAQEPVSGQDMILVGNVLTVYNVGYSRLDVMAQLTAVSEDGTESETMSAQVGSVDLINWEGQIPHLRQVDVHLTCIFYADIDSKKPTVRRQSACYHHQTWTSAYTVPLYVFSRQEQPESALFSLNKGVYAVMPSTLVVEVDPAAALDSITDPVDDVELAFEASATADAPPPDGVPLDDASAAGGPDDLGVTG